MVTYREPLCYVPHSMTLYNYKIIITHWIDGDTFDAIVDLGFNVMSKIRFRLLDIDTPERGEINYREAQSCSAGVYPVGTEVQILSIKGRATDKYGRWLVHLPKVNEELILKQLTKIKASK